MRTVTSRVHQCASCGQFSKVLTCAYSPLVQSEILLCPTCFAWRDREREQPARMAWSKTHSRIKNEEAAQAQAVG